MPFYMIQEANCAPSTAAMIRNPHDRTPAVLPAIQGLGGNLHSVFVSFGEYDTVMIVEMPDDVRATALMKVFVAGGGVKAIKTTPLLTLSEVVDALKLAGTVHYEPPQGPVPPAPQGLAAP